MGNNGASRVCELKGESVVGVKKEI
jgi:hypothetical protein